MSFHKTRDKKNPSVENLSVKNLSFGIIGTGKLANQLIELAKNTQHSIEYIFSNRDINQDEYPAPVTNNINILNSADIIIDCSITGFDERAMHITKPIIIATTQEHKKHTNSPTLILPNASISWNLVHIMLAKLNKLGNYEFSIIDIHHQNKKDSPSGTAKKLINELEQEEASINFSVHRIGEIFGIHSIFAISDNDMIKIEHQAFSRDTFAQGLIMAAEWLAEQTQTGYIEYTAQHWLSDI